MAAVDYFLKIDGIEGESKDKTNANEIELMSFSFGATNSGTAGHGTGMGAGKVSIQDFHFTMYMNKASVNLFKAVASGKHLPKAVLTCRKPTGEGGQTAYFKATFDDLLISSYQTGGSSGGDPRIVEQISFNFSKVKFEYSPQDAKGIVGKAIEGGWDAKASVVS